MFAKFTLLSWFFMFSPMVVPGQNLIVDPGFEEVEFVFDGEDTVYQYTHWKSLLPFKKISLYGHPKYSKYSSFTKSEKARDAWKPYEGDSQLIPHLLHHRNLYQTKLIQPLEPGKNYRVKFKYRILASMYPKERVALEINHKLGGRFTVADLCTQENLENFHSYTFKYPPHFKVSNYHPDSLFKWLDYEYVFQAEYPYEFLTVGNFVKIAETADEAYNPSRGISFRIDLVSLEQVDDTFKSVTIPSEPMESQILQLPEVSITLDTSGTMNATVMQYYQWVLKSESFIINNQPDSSIAAYLIAFKLKKPSFRDYRNASSVWKKTGTIDSTVIKEIVSLRSTGAQKNQIISNQIDSIFQLDQSARTGKGGITEQDSTNHHFVLDMFNKYEISESTVGVNGMSNLGVILLHLSRYPAFKNLLEKLRQEVLKGNFDARMFANLTDSYFEHNVSFSKFNTYFYTNASYPIFTRFLVPRFEDEKVSEINKRRAAIGLESLEGQYEKQFYNFKNGYREYEFYQFFTWFPTEEFCTEEEKISYLEKEKTMIQEFMDTEKNLIIWTK